MAEAAKEKMYKEEDLRAHHAQIMQLISLDALLPHLVKHNLLSSDDIDQVSSKHHRTIERASFLLHLIYRKDVINSFVQCLKTEKKHKGHQRILQLLERGKPDMPNQSPLLEILNSKLDVLERIDLTALLNTLANSGAIKVDSFLDLVNPDRQVRENLERLLSVLEEKGTRGFIDFLCALQKDSSPTHDEIFKILFVEVQRFFKEDPRRGEVMSSDRIEILQLETRGKALEQDVLQRFKVNRTQFMARLDLVALLPFLHKHCVLSKEEEEDVAARPSAEEGNRTLLELMDSKSPFWVVKFAECLKESPEHQTLAELLFPPPPPARVMLRSNVALHKHDKVAVFLTMDRYTCVTHLVSEYDTGDAEQVDGKRLKQEREILRDRLAQLNFKVVDLMLSDSVACTEVEVEHRKMGMHHYEHRLVVEKFKTEVVNICTDDAAVFIYVSGIQFPYKDPDDPNGKFTGAVLLSEASTISRTKQTDCVKAQNLSLWVKLLPSAHVTFLIDCEQNFITKFEKQHVSDVVDLAEDPWDMLAGLNLTTVVYYLKPDVPILSQRTETGIRKAVGSLTESFNYAFSHCLTSKQKGSKTCYLSHRMFYEAISFHWHKRGRLNRLFMPAIVGDMDREFLGRSCVPYRQVFRMNLLRTRKEGLFNPNKFHIQIGTIAGVEYGDELEIFHVLRPGVRVKGRVTESYPINCSVEVPTEEDRKKLIETLLDIYQDKNLLTKDGSTEFLLAIKVLPLIQRVSVDTDGLNEVETITVKTYLETQSSHLSYVSQGTKPSRVVVCKSGCDYFVRDLEEDVKEVVKVRRLELILTFLESIAWYKYVKSLGGRTLPPYNQYKCFLTSECPLLHKSSPLCDEFEVKWSSFEGVPPTSKGHEVILQNMSPQTFWTPSHPSKDPQPYLGVELKDNHVITSIELKGDDTENKYVKKATIYHQRDVFNSVIEGPNKDHMSRVVPISHDESVQLVSITPHVFLKNFTVNFRLKLCTVTSKKISREVQGLSVANWPYYVQKKTSWMLNPSPNQTGFINLASQQWMSWSGDSYEQITFDLGASDVKLEMIEFACFNETNFLSRFALRVQTFFQKDDMLTIKSVWPSKYEFPRPLVLSNLQLWPSDYSQDSNIKVQMQLYGNKHEQPIEVEEGELLSFHFSNFTKHVHFIYIYCLDETGVVKFLMKDVAEPVYQVAEGGKSVSKYPVMKKMINTYIPENYNPESGYSKDIYKVFVCKHQLYLDPLEQHSPSHYHLPLSYPTNSSLRHKELSQEPCYDFTFEVIVKQSTRR